MTVRENPYVREGYEFAGWNTAADGTGESCEPGDRFTLSESTTLYAQWKQKDGPIEPTEPTEPTDPSNPGGDNGNNNGSNGNAGSTQQAGSGARKGGSSVPKTGDNSGATVPVAAGAAALGALCVAFGRKKRGKNE